MPLTEEFTWVSPKGLQRKQQRWVDKTRGEEGKAKHMVNRTRRRETRGLGAGNLEQVLPSVSLSI